MSQALPSPNSNPGKTRQNVKLARLPPDAVEAVEREIEWARSSLSHPIALIPENPTAASRDRRGGLTSWQAQRTISLINQQRRPPFAELAANLNLVQSH